jgi:phage shock protein C
LYRSRHGLVFGVCKGLADYGQLPVFWVRVILLAVTLLTWILPFVILYVVAAFLIKPETTLEPQAEEDWRSYCTHACTQSIALAQLKRELDQVEYRLLRLERDASARQYDWEKRLQEGQ